METTFVLDALEQALWARRPSGTIHHSDKGSQYVSLAYMQRLQDAGLLASTGSSGDSYDNAMAESINGLYKAEVIHRQSWKSRAEVELATLTWVDWYNSGRLLERLGHIPRLKPKSVLCFHRKRSYGSLSSRTKNSPGKPGRFRIFLRSSLPTSNLLLCKRKNRLAGRFYRRLSQLAGCLTR
jgi:putative transposase